MVSAAADEASRQSQLDHTQVLKASNALLKHIKTKKSSSSKQNLLATDVDAPENDLPIWLSITTKTFVVDKKRLKPARIPLVHPFASDDATVCLFVKDPQRMYKDMIEEAGLSSRVTRVVGVSKLKEKHKSFEAKRALRDAHDVFMADDRVVTLLPQLLGKTFYAGKKNPLPIVVPKKSEKTENLKIEVNKALNATHLHLSPGTCTLIKVGLAGQTAEQITENIAAVANRVIHQFIPSQWKGLRALHIKTAESVALPIWQTNEIFDAEVDKIKVEEEPRMIENGDATKSKSKKRDVPGITVESIETIYSEKPAKKRKTEHKIATATSREKDMKIRPAVVKSPLQQQKKNRSAGRKMNRP